MPRPTRRRFGWQPPLIQLGQRLRGRVQRFPDANRLLLCLLLIGTGIAIVSAGAISDVTLHRGVETGGEAPWVRHPTGRDLATNVDLTQFAPEQLDAVAAALQAGNFRYVRQSFAWSEIEPEPGIYRWERYDPIVDVLSRHFITPVAVLHRAPAWARSPDQVTAFDAPPARFADFERFVTAVVGRYGDRLPFVQLWDQPNQPERWGGVAADPAQYVELLSVGSNAARAASPTTLIVLAEFAPSRAGEIPDGDVQFLRGVYRAGGMPFFHVVAARVSGGERTPWDPRVDAAIPSLSRVTLLREVMKEAGDDAKPVWATHYGWQSGDAAGMVNSVDQAAYTVAGLERARGEWPWMGPMFAWGLLPGPSLAGEVMPGEALLQPSGSATLLFDALNDYAVFGVTDAAPTGFLPVNARQFVYEGNWELQHLGTTTYRTTREQGARTSVRFTGTGVILLVRQSPEAGRVTAELDGQEIDVDLTTFQARDIEVPLAEGLEDRAHELILTLAEPGQFTIGGLQVERTEPLRWPMALLLGCGLGLIFLGLRGMVYIVAERTGHLQRRRGVDLWPELPPLPDWRPERRA